ncbi:MAG: hypothetical protein ACR2PF_09460, partial [Rhizobiaceae bacterium]
MAGRYQDVDAETRAALMLTRGELMARLGTRATVYSSNEELISAFADRILADYQSCLDAGRREVTMIVPVGPVGQYSVLADRSLKDGISLDRLTLFLMDEYL